MELSFATKALRTLAMDANVAESALGVAVAASLRARVADLLAAESIHDLVAGRPALTSSDRPTVTLELGDDHVIVARPNHNVLPKADGTLDWSRVWRLQILYIGQAGLS